MSKVIVLEKDNNKVSFTGKEEEAQKAVNEGWTVFINKTGKKLVKQVKKATKKK